MLDKKEKKVLIVDDDEMMNDMLVSLVSSAGYEAIGMLSATEALKLIKSGDVDLIITDIIMPEVEGLELIQYLKSKYSNIPVIAMSGGGLISSDKYLTLSEKFGALHTFSKPFDTEPFLEAIENCLA